MAPPGTIIGQIQATPTAPNALQQVAAAAATNQAQLHQLQTGQPTLTITTAPQQVPLPATVPPIHTTIKDDIIDSNNGTNESVTQSSGNIEILKENGISDSGELNFLQYE